MYVQSYRATELQTAVRYIQVIVTSVAGEWNRGVRRTVLSVGAMGPQVSVSAVPSLRRFGPTQHIGTQIKTKNS